MIGSICLQKVERNLCTVIADVGCNRFMGIEKIKVGINHHRTPIMG